MTATKTNEIANLARSLKRITDGAARVTTTTKGNRSAIVVYAGEGRYTYVIGGTAGYVVIDCNSPPVFLDDAESVKSYVRAVFDE